ncbi:hypothetical protein EDB83DRAFT_2519861 [Lactarius deliciosus]|nr:hypothetical protein EDB83DRAFT_2519861 [Lactarius deliciosus]
MTAPEPVTGENLPKEDQLEYIDEDVAAPDPIKELTTAFHRLTPIHTDTTLIEEDIEPATRPIPGPITSTIFDIHACPVVPAIPTTAPAMAAVPLTGAFKGAAPTTFTGNRTESEQFLREFRQFCRNNCNHESFISLYLRVGLSMQLHTRTRQTDKVLWTNFETSFKTAWTDTLSKQNAYQQLTTLRMSKDDTDGYIAMFERLAHVAEWHRNASGTVEFFHRGLTTDLLRACLHHTLMPETMDEWQTAT